MRSEVFLGGLLAAFLLTPAAALQVAVISDLNGSYGSAEYSSRVHAAVDWIIAQDPDLVLSTGDMVAGQRSPLLSDAEVLAMWSAFHETVSTPLQKAGIPLAVTPGNHDASGYARFARERDIYAAQWAARKPDLSFIDDADYPFFYAFELGGVRFASLDATTLGPLRGDQHDRLRAAFDETQVTITFSHLPLFPFAIGREREIIGDPALEALYADLAVDLHLSGHHHAFWRGWKDGVAYVSQACLGGGPRRLIGGADRAAHALTLLEIAQDGAISVEARLSPDYDRSVDIDTLPRAIGALLRIDLR